MRFYFSFHGLDNINKDIYSFKFRSTVSPASPLLFPGWPIDVFAAGKKVRKGCGFDPVLPDKWVGSFEWPYREKEKETKDDIWEILNIKNCWQKKKNLTLWVSNWGCSPIQDAWGGANLRKSLVKVKPWCSSMNFFVIVSDMRPELEGFSLKWRVQNKKTH